MKDKTHRSLSQQKNQQFKGHRETLERNINQHSSEAREHAAEKAGITVPSLAGQAFFRRVWEDAH